VTGQRRIRAGTTGLGYPSGVGELAGDVEELSVHLLETPASTSKAWSPDAQFNGLLPELRPSVIGSHVVDPDDLLAPDGIHAGSLLESLLQGVGRLGQVAGPGPMFDLLADDHVADPALVSVPNGPENLDIAMRSRAVIEQAKGILMSQRRWDAAEAFNLLAAASQRSNRKLRDIAQAIVDGVSGQNSQQNCATTPSPAAPHAASGRCTG
jgi:hypothetical protein